ncbi:uncharacterized protein LOC141904540 [Tubulanus polymorphus]|uniref:uncharacterized protein LOC141904540 n=1 Tax=Tubulanus polymorphus TaxID=672921 RepID=UPI003DA2B9F7
MMSSVQSLAYIARDTCVQLLIGRREYSDTEDNNIIDLLSTDHFTAVSESILNRLVDLYPKRLTQTVLRSCAPPHMKKLCLKKCDKLRDYGIDYVINRCKPHYLNLSECHEGLIRPGLISLCSHNLQNLTSFTAESTDISNESVHTILVFLPRLKHLGLSSCNELTDEVFLIREEDQLLQERHESDSLEMLSSLTSVDISACQKIGSMGIRNLVTLCGRTLNHLDFSWTKVDCMSFWYLGGFSFNSAVFLAMNVSKLKGHSFEDILQECSDVMNKCISIENIGYEPVNSNQENVDKCGNSLENSTVDGGLIETNNISVESTSNVVDNVRQHISPFLPQWGGSDAQGTLQLMLEDVKLTTSSSLPVQDVSDTSLNCDMNETLLVDQSLGATRTTIDPSEESSSPAKSRTQCPENTFIPRSRLKWFEPALISLNANSIDFSHENLNALCCKAFFLSNPALKRLTLSWKDLTDEILEYIANCCRNLTEISLIECERVTTLGVLTLGNVCKDLQTLNLRGVLHADNHKAVIPLITSKIQRLDLSECDVTDPVLTAIANNCKDRLVHLDLSWCENVTEQGLLELIKSCHNLRVLILHQCEVTIQVLDSMSLNCPALTKLSLFMVREINDSAVVTLVERLNCLEDIDLSWNDKLTDVSLEAILVKCIKLKQLCIAGLKLITSNPLMPIIGAPLKLKNAERVILGRDEHYNSPSDEEYKNRHRSTSYAINLRYINLNYCDRINDSQLNEIAYCCAGSLRIIDYYGYEIEPVGFPIG